MYLALVAMALLWGTVFVVVKLGGRAMPVLVFNADRFIIGWCILALVTWASGRWQRVDGRTALHLTLLGLLGHGLMQMAFVSGIMRTTATMSALIYGCVPLMVAAISAILGLEKPGLRQWCGLALAAVGMAVVVLLRPGDGTATSAAMGNALVAFAGLCMALYTVLSRRLLARLDLMFVMTWVLGVGAIAMLLWSLPSQSVDVYRAMTWQGWGVVLYGALLALVAPNLLMLLGIREFGRARTAAFINAVPPIGCLAGYLLLGETLRPPQLVGALTILAGIVLTQLKTPQPPPAVLAEESASMIDSGLGENG